MGAWDSCLPVAAGRAAAGDGLRLVEPVESVFTCESPEPGIPSVRVTRPEEFAEILAPRTPALRPTLFGVIVIRIPGAILNDLRTLKPMFFPCVFRLPRHAISRPEFYVIDMVLIDE